MATVAGRDCEKRIDGWKSFGGNQHSLCDFEHRENRR